MNDLQNLRVGDLRSWYDQWYAPNNATVVVVGDVQPHSVLELARKHFGPLKPRDTAQVKPRTEVEQLGMRRVTVKAPAEVPYLVMGYKVPALRTAEQSWEPYALEVLAGVLDGGQSARLATALVRGRQVAARAGAGYDIYARLDSMLELDGTPAEGHTVQDLEAALRDQIKRLREAPVDAQELERVKAQVVASNVYERDSVFYQAMQIGILETVGLGWPVLEEYVDRVRAVTVEQVQKVARKYLDDDRLTIAILNPQPVKERKPPDTPGGPHDDIR